MNKLIALQPEVYQKLKQQAENVVPAHTSVEAKVLFQLDEEMQQILNSQRSDREKVKLYNSVLQKSKLIRKKVRRPQTTLQKPVSENDILKKFKKKARVKTLLSEIKKHKNLSWDSEGHLVVDQQPVPSSNIDTLLRSAVVKREPSVPGWREFEGMLWESL